MLFFNLQDAFPELPNKYIARIPWTISFTASLAGPKIFLKQKAGTKIRSIIADSQYSSKEIRNAVDEAVIPYPANQKRGIKGLLRVDKKFRTHGPEGEKRKYHKRSVVEAVYSFLKTQFSLAINKVRGLKNVTVYALYSILSSVLNREAAENIRRPDKASKRLAFPPLQGK